MVIPMPATVDDLLAHLDKTLTATEQAELALHLEAATEAAEGWHRVGPIVVRSFTDRVRTKADCRLFLPRTPVQTVTSATRIPDGLQYLTAALDVRKSSGIVSGLNQRLTPGEYTVVYDAGRNPVPASLKLAVLIIAGHLWQTQQGPTTNRFVGEGGGESGFRSGMGYLIPNRAAHLLAPYAAVAVA